MANLIKWIKDREKNVLNAAKDVGGFASRVYDQANPLDNNRTFQQRTPTNNQSAMEQVANSGASHVAQDIIRPAVRFPINYANAFANLGHRAAGGRQQTPEQQFSDPITAATQNFGQASGTNRQLLGDAAQIGIGAFAPGTSRIAEQAAIKLAPKAASTILPKVASGVAVGAPVGAASNVASLVSSDQNLTPKSVATSAAQGAVGGAVAGAALPVASEAIKAAAPVVRQGVTNASNTVRARNEGLGEAGFVKVPGGDGLIKRRYNPVTDDVDAQKNLDLQQAISRTSPTERGLLSLLDDERRKLYASKSNTDKIAPGITRAEITKVNGMVNALVGIDSPANYPRDRAIAEALQYIQERGYKDIPVVSDQQFLGRFTNSNNMDKGDLSRSARTILPSATTLDRKLPTYGTRKEGNISKAFRSTRSIIERQGPSGRELGNMLQQGRDTQELFLADVQKRLPTVRSLKGKDFEDFVDATQGLSPPKTPKIAQAVSEWQAVHPEIRQRAVNAGLDVGDLGQTYYPHFIDYERVFKDKNTYNEAINHLVSTGQAATQEDAIRLLGYARDVSRNRQFGNLEASRLVDLPMYDKTPNSLISYLSGSGKRIAQTETFGAKDEKALDLIRKIGVEGGDTEAAKNSYDIAVGAKQYNPTTSKISQNIRKYITTTRLGLGALTNVSQNVNTGIVTGHLRTLASAVKQLDPKTRGFVEDTGVIADAVLNDIRTQSGFASFGQRAAGKVVDKITAPFFGTVEKLNRSISATAGRDYGLRLAQIGADDTLRKLGVTGDIVNRTLTPAQQIQVARKVVEKTQFKVDAQDLPGWTDTPGGKLVSQFRTFSYAQGKFVSNEILKPAARGDLRPLARLLAALPLGYALYETKRKIAGRPEEENKGKIGLAAFQNVGGAGLAFDIYQSLNPVGSKYLPPDRRTSMAVGAFGGPAIGTAAQGVGAVSEAAQRKNTPTDDSRLEGKVVAGKTPNDYTDLTSLSRFGLQQVPIVGTAVKNRLLPFTKESNADAGKSGTAPANKSGDGKVAGDVEKIDEGNKQRTKNYKASFSKDDYSIMQLSKKDQEKLVSQGTISQQKLDGLRNYADNKKKELGYENVSKKTDYRSSPDAEFKAAKEKYDKDKKEGKISSVQDIKRSSELKRLEVGSTFDKDVRDLYTLSKQKIYDFVTSNENGNALVDKLKQYDQALLDKGLITSSKFKTGIAPKKGGGRTARGGRKSKGGRKGKGAKTSTTNVSAAIKSRLLPSVGRVKQTSFRPGSVKLPSMPSVKAKPLPKRQTAGSFGKLMNSRKLTA